jgi:hypothetical protein
MRSSDFLPPVTTRLRFLRRRLPAVWRRQDLPGSWAALVHVPRAVTPIGLWNRPPDLSPSSVLTFLLRAFAFHHTKGVGPTMFTLTRLISAAHALAVYASRAASRQLTQDSLPAGGTPWPAGACTRWATSKVSGSTSLLLTQACPGALASRDPHIGRGLCTPAWTLFLAVL